MAVDLNAVLAKAANGTDVKYVDIPTKFAGRGLGDTSSSWLTGFSLLNPTASFHPNTTGQAKYAEAIVAAMGNS